VCSTAIRKGDEKGCCLFLVLVLVLHDLDWKGMQDRQLFKILVTVLRFLVEDALADWSQCTLQFIRERPNLHGNEAIEKGIAMAMISH